MLAQLRPERDGSATVLALPEHVDATAVLTFERDAGRARVAGRRRLIADLRATDIIDTPTLAELCLVLRRVLADGWRVAVVGGDRRVESVLLLCGLDGLELHRTLRSARRRHPRAPPAGSARRGPRIRSPQT